MANSKKVSQMSPTTGRCGHVGRKPPFCRWNFDVIYHSSRDISTSGLGGHIAISGCRSLSQWLRNTFFGVDVVGKLDFVTWVTTILIPDLFYHSSQHDHKISPVSKKSLVFDVMPNNFRCSDWRPDCCIFTHSIYRKNHQKTTPNAEQNFFCWFKKWAGGFFTPKPKGGLNIGLKWGVAVSLR